MSAERWGVWCLEDRAWCQGTVGTKEHASAALPRWQSGRAAEVDPNHFHYELRPVLNDAHTSELDALKHKAITQGVTPEEWDVEVARAMRFLQKTTPPDVSCSFCGKKVGEPVSDFQPETMIRHIIQGPKVSICDDCVSLCDTMLIENGIAPARSSCTLDNCGHMRQLDAIVDLLGMPRGTRSVLDELRARAAAEWEDVEDEWSAAIGAAHPARSDSHEEYGVAMTMVGHRHSKGALVALVNWLLVMNKRGERL